MGRRQPVVDPWSALPGTGRESTGGELGGTSEEHEEGIPEGRASFHAQGRPRYCLYPLPPGQPSGAEKYTSSHNFKNIVLRTKEPHGAGFRTSRKIKW